MKSETPPTPVILDDEALAEIEARANAATRAPWRQSALAGMYIVGDKTDFATIASVGEYNPDGSIHLAFADAEANLSFITHAREDIPALCQTVRALRDELKVADDALETQVKWIGELRKENAALREQLAAAHKNIESLTQTIFRSEQSTRMRERCVSVVKEIPMPTHLSESGEEIVTHFRARVIRYLESLTLDGETEQ